MNPDNGWLILTHSHERFPAFDEADILDALPQSIREGPRQQARIHGQEEIGPDLTRVDWEALQHEQAREFERVVAPWRQEGRGVVYFGRAYIPLAIDLGFRVENWVPHQVFQYHRDSKSWRWPGRSSGDPVLEVHTEDNLPTRPSNGTGPVAIRVGVTTRIAREDVLARLPNPMGDIEIHLGDGCGVTALRSHDDLERVARAFESQLYHALEIYPQAESIHLFAAVPQSLAFRMGTMINPTVHPLIQTYKHVRNAEPKYQRALVVGQRAPSEMKVRIQFLAAEPDTTRRLRIDRELRDIVASLRDGERRERFELSDPRTAVRINDLQTYIRRDAAHVLHFSGHGEPGGDLLLEDRAGDPVRVAPDTLRLLLDAWNDDGHIRCVVINACHSLELARELTRKEAVVPCAIGTSRDVVDGAALCFSEGFYRALADGVTLKRSFRAGVEQVRLQHRGEAEAFYIEVADDSLLDRPLFAAG